MQCFRCVHVISPSDVHIIHTLLSLPFVMSRVRQATNVLELTQGEHLTPAAARRAEDLLEREIDDNRVLGAASAAERAAAVVARAEAETVERDRGHASDEAFIDRVFAYIDKRSLDGACTPDDLVWMDSQVALIDERLGAVTPAAWRAVVARQAQAARDQRLADEARTRRLIAARAASAAAHPTRLPPSSFNPDVPSHAQRLLGHALHPDRPSLF